MNRGIEKRLAALEHSFRSAHHRCPLCRKPIAYVDIDDDGIWHCGRCAAPLEPESSPQIVKVYVGIRDGVAADED